MQMIPVETSYMLVDTERAADLDTVMDLMLQGDHDYRYSWHGSTANPPDPTRPFGAHPW